MTLKTMLPLSHTPYNNTRMCVLSAFDVRKSDFFHLIFQQFILIKNFFNNKHEQPIFDGLKMVNEQIYLYFFMRLYKATRKLIMIVMP
jgi:hypothetical protein